MLDDAAITIDLPETEAKLRQFIEDGVIPGGILAWGTVGAPVQYHAEGRLGFGRSEAVDERSIFRIYSQTKPITGIAAMMLIEDGVIALDQAISEILPAFAEMRVMEGDDPEVTRPAAQPITIRHLLTHTAGFGMAGMTLGALYMKHGVAPGTRERVAGPGELPTPTSLAELGNRIAALPLAADPGTRFDYSVARSWSAACSNRWAWWTPAF
jgi:CubicO group peptidase (beta-lactamase class C family)